MDIMRIEIRIYENLHKININSGQYEVGHKAVATGSGFEGFVHFLARVVFF